MRKSIIAVCNHKGGVDKTTVAVALAQYLASKFRVLFIDMDPQGSATGIFVDRSIANDLVWILEGSNRPQCAGAVDALSDVDLKDFG